MTAAGDAGAHRSAGLATTDGGSAPVPPGVTRAQQQAEAHGFTLSCRDEVERLLAVLAASATGCVAELGTGFGCGTAWLAAGLAPSGTIVTVDIDARSSALAPERWLGGFVVLVDGDAMVLRGHRCHDRDLPIRSG